MQSFNHYVGTARSFTKWTAGISLVAYLVIASMPRGVAGRFTAEDKTNPASEKAEYQTNLLRLTSIISVISFFIYLVTIPTQWASHRIITYLEG